MSRVWVIKAEVESDDKFLIWAELLVKVLMSNMLNEEILIALGVGRYIMSVHVQVIDCTTV